MSDPIIGVQKSALEKILSDMNMGMAVLGVLIHRNGGQPITVHKDECAILDGVSLLRIEGDENSITVSDVTTVAEHREAMGLDPIVQN